MKMQYLAGVPDTTMSILILNSKDDMRNSFIKAYDYNNLVI